MAKKLLRELTDAELSEAHRLWGELVAQTRRNASKFPGPGWASVIDKLEEAGGEYEAEVARRLQPNPPTE